MAKPTNEIELLAEIQKERSKLEALLETIPTREKSKEVVDGMSVKDILAHRTEWGRMMLSWHEEAKAGLEPVTPHKKYKWNQLPELNASIQKKFAKSSLKKIQNDFSTVHDDLRMRIKGMSEKELYEKGFYPFTKSTNLAAYINSSTAAHYRSATKLIRKWWKEQTA